MRGRGRSQDEPDWVGRVREDANDMIKNEDTSSTDPSRWLDFLSPMKIGSLFSGVGGFDLGLEYAGHEIVWQAEADKHCQAVLRYRWPQIPLLKDVRDVRATELDTPDLICGGFPCQDLSVAGQRRGLEGSRSGLWWEFHRILGEFTDTKWCLIENVPGLLSSNRGEDFAVLLRSLADIGFHDTAWRVLDSRYFAVPQRRRRLFILATRDPGGRCPTEILAISESCQGDSTSSQQKREVAAGKVSGGSGARSEGGLGPYWDGGDISDTLDVSMLVKGQMMPEKRRCPVVMPFRKAQKAHSPEDHERWEVADEANTLTAHGTTSDLIAYNVYPERGQGSLLRASETDLGNIRGRYGASERGTRVVDERPRRLTPRECERLQGFPDDFTRYGAKRDVVWQRCPACDDFYCTRHGLHAGDCECPAIEEFGDDPYGAPYELPDTARYRAMGNAVTVTVAAWIGMGLRLQK